MSGRKEGLGHAPCVVSGRDAVRRAAKPSGALLHPARPSRHRGAVGRVRRGHRGASGAADPHRAGRRGLRAGPAGRGRAPPAEHPDRRRRGRLRHGAEHAAVRRRAPEPGGPGERARGRRPPVRALGGPHRRRRTQRHRPAQRDLGTLPGPGRGRGAARRRGRHSRLGGARERVAARGGRGGDDRVPGTARGRSAPATRRSWWRTTSRIRPPSRAVSRCAGFDAGRGTHRPAAPHRPHGGRDRARPGRRVPAHDGAPAVRPAASRVPCAASPPSICARGCHRRCPRW